MKLHCFTLTVSVMSYLQDSAPLLNTTAEVLPEAKEYLDKIVVNMMTEPKDTPESILKACVVLLLPSLCHVSHGQQLAFHTRLSAKCGRP